MTFRLDRLPSSENQIVFYLCGRIQLEHLDAIRESIAKETGNPILDLTQVTLADRAAVTFLAKCEIQGIRLRNVPGFLTEWIAKEKGQIATGDS